jgi:NAD(P)H-flavin reductase
MLGVRGPFGNGWPLERARGDDLMIVAGGLGMAPLRPALYHALSHRSDYGRIVLLYGARTPGDLLYKTALEESGSRRDLDLELIVNAAGGEWNGHVGVVTSLISSARFDPVNTTALVCGPEIMMTLVAEALLQAGVADRDIHVSIERNMKCAAGFCGHCQFGPAFVCKDGPVFSLPALQPFLELREV